MSYGQWDAHYKRLQVPVVVELAQYYLVWVDVEEHETMASAADSIRRSGVAYEYVDGETAFDGDMVVRTPYVHELYNDPLGPWPLCAEEECEVTAWNYYGYRHCSRHQPRDPIPTS